MTIQDLFDFSNYYTFYPLHFFKADQLGAVNDRRAFLCRLNVYFRAGHFKLFFTEIA